MMTKIERKFFSIVDYEKEAEYLRKMHQSGWKFEKMTGLGRYHFVACEPEDVIYQLDYNQEGLKNKEEYVQMFEDCGWEYLQDAFGYSYFRKPAAEAGEEEGIFCDDESRMAMLKRVFVGRLVPLIVIFCCCLLPQFFNTTALYHVPVLAGVLGALIGVYVAIFVVFAIKYYKYMKREDR